MSARDVSASSPCCLAPLLPANGGTLETVDSQELWTARNSGQPGIVDSQELWTARNCGKPGTMDSQELWTDRNC